MFIVQDKKTGRYYKQFTNYGFRTTLDIKEATQFKDIREAEAILKITGVQKTFEEPHIERVQTITTSKGILTVIPKKTSQ